MVLYSTGFTPIGPSVKQVNTVESFTSSSMQIYM